MDEIQANINAKKASFKAGYTTDSQGQLIKPVGVKLPADPEPMTGKELTPVPEKKKSPDRRIFKPKKRQQDSPKLNNVPSQEEVTEK